MANILCRPPATSSSSRCVTGSATAAHDFGVASFSLLDGIGNGRCVSSGHFTAGGCDWAVLLFPDGSQVEARGTHVSVYLSFWGGATPAAGRGGVRVSFTLSLLLDRHGGGGGGVSNLCRVAAKTFTAVGQDWGFSHFIEKPKLQRMIRANGGDCFTIRCVVTVIKESRSEPVEKTMIPKSSLHQDLADMMKNWEGSDVTFSVGGRLFHAHRCMLAARSMVFKAKLFGAMREKSTGCIEIDDMEPAIFEALLHFIYTDSIPVDADGCREDETAAMQHLLVAADRYALDRLKVMCESKLCQRIDVQTVATTLVLAEQHHCTHLKDACLEFIASRNVLDAIVQTEGFKHLIESCPVIMKEILDKAAAIRRH
ncbi:hypothetical protein ACP4OV_025638 [Aristida adscensionis]